MPAEERKYDHSERFGEGESMRTCAQISKETGATIEISTSKDKSLTFLISGKKNNVIEAKRKVLTNFQTQVIKNESTEGYIVYKNEITEGYIVYPVGRRRSFLIGDVGVDAVMVWYSVSFMYEYI